MMMTISSLVKCSQWPDTSINRTWNTARSHYTWRTNDWFENTRVTKTYKTETSTSWNPGRDQDQLLWDGERDQI